MNEISSVLLTEAYNEPGAGSPLHYLPRDALFDWQLSWSESATGKTRAARSQELQRSLLCETFWNLGSWKGKKKSKANNINFPSPLPSLNWLTRTHTHAEEPQSLSSTWEGWSKGHRVHIYLPSICCKKYRNGPLASGSMKSYQATVFIEASKIHWGTRYYPHIVPTGIAGCSKKLAKNASYVGQPAGDTEVSQLPPQRLFRTPSPHRGTCQVQRRARGSSAPRPAAAQHQEPTGLPLLCRILRLAASGGAWPIIHCGFHHSKWFTAA